MKNKKPRLSHLVQFGSKCTVYLEHKSARSTKPKATKGIILGIYDVQKGYYVYLEESKTVITTKNVQNVYKLNQQDLQQMFSDDELNVSTTSLDNDSSISELHQQFLQQENTNANNKNTDSNNRLTASRDTGLGKIFDNLQVQEEEFQLPAELFLSLKITDGFKNQKLYAKQEKVFTGRYGMTRWLPNLML